MDNVKNKKTEIREYKLKFRKKLKASGRKQYWLAEKMGMNRFQFQRKLEGGKFSELEKQQIDVLLQ